MLVPKTSLLGRVKNSLSLGWLAGLLSVLVFIFELLVLLFCEWMTPASEIDIAVDFDSRRYTKRKEQFGDHKFSVAKYEARNRLKPTLKTIDLAS